MKIHTKNSGAKENSKIGLVIELYMGRISDLKTVENKNPHFAANPNYNFIRVQLEDGTEIPLLFTDVELKRAKLRAEKNLEDLPKTNWIRNLFD